MDMSVTLNLNSIPSRVGGASGTKEAGPTAVPAGVEEGAFVRIYVVHRGVLTHIQFPAAAVEGRECIYGGSYGTEYIEAVTYDVDGARPRIPVAGFHFSNITRNQFGVITGFDLTIDSSVRPTYYDLKITCGDGWSYRTVRVL